MTTLSRLEQWKDEGIITGEQFDAIAGVVRKDRFSIFFELNALLYLGVISIVAGVGWVIQAYFANVGDAVIISSLTLLLFLSFYYCFTRSMPYSTAQVQSPNLAFDYVLYGGCLLFGIEIAYIEERFHLLDMNADLYLLGSALIFFALAYRFDNRLVLSLALSSLAAWFGVRLSQSPQRYGDSLRPYAIAYGTIVAGMGGLLHAAGVKKHFTETYLHIAANVTFVALVSGVLDESATWLYLVGLLGLAAAGILHGIWFRRFAFLAYGIIYGYIGISAEILRGRTIESTFALTYLMVSGIGVVGFIVFLARVFGREE
jgi:Predicted membrane protein (DUF2157)